VTADSPQTLQGTPLYLKGGSSSSRDPRGGAHARAPGEGFKRVRGRKGFREVASPGPTAVRHSIHPIPALTTIQGVSPPTDALPAHRAREQALGWGAALIALAVAFAGDYLTGEQVSFSLGYMVAIGTATWFASRTAGLILAGMSAIAWLSSYLLVGQSFASPTILYWNIAVEAGIYLATAVAIAQVRDGVSREQLLSSQVSRAYGTVTREVESAGALQRELLSRNTVDIPGYESRVHYTPSARAGGDLYDFIPLADGRVGIVIADASGHGVSAAVLMGMTLVLTRSASGAGAPEKVLERVNAQLYRTLPPGSFATACYLILDPETGRLQYTLAGHDPPLIRRAASLEVQRLPLIGGTPLGLRPEFPEVRGTTILNPGDTLVLYTHGVTEAMNPSGETFGQERLAEALESSAGAVDRVMGSVLVAVNAHAEGAALQDDVTLVLVRRGGSICGGRYDDGGGGGGRRREHHSKRSDEVEHDASFHPPARESLRPRPEPRPTPRP
jgi:serine phosphatase RsbU (regulator of sigma subunit)